MDDKSKSNPDKKEREDLRVFSGSSSTEGINSEKASDSPEDASIIPDIEGLPPEARKVMEFGMMAMSRSGPGAHPLISKMTPEHISKILDLSAKEEDNSFKSSNSDRSYGLAYFIITLVFFTILIIYLTHVDKEMLMVIIKYAITAAGGFGGGYGYKAYKERKS